MSKSSSSPYKAVIFDLEGTLVNFQWNEKAAIDETLLVLESMGIKRKIFPNHDYATIFNKALDECTNLGYEKDIVRHKISQIYDRYDMDALRRWSLRSDSFYVLNRLKERAIPISMVTNVGRKAVELLIKQTNIEQFFNIIITRDDVDRIKPSGEGIEKALKELMVNKSEVLYIGDSVTDILATKEVGMDSAIVIGGESDLSEIMKYNPNFILKSLSEVLSLF